MKMVKVIFSGLLVVGFLMNVSVAQVDTVRVATVEDQQRKEAIMSAQTANAEQDNSSFQVVITEEPNTQNQAPTQLEQNVSQSLRPVTLEEEIQQQRVQSKLELFGYEMFNSVATTFAPVSDMPVPYDYVIGPGDTFTIQAFAATNVQYNLTVTREGMLLIPDAGAVNLSGLTFEEAKVVISEAIETRRIGIKTIVTLSEFRSIQIMLVGEVSKPGSYSVSGFSTLINALVSSGGVKRTGSLRNIQVKRHGSVVATFDLYALLLKGDDSANIYLRQGDLIFVPPVGPTVGIAGEILRPAIYELANEQNVSEILSLAGGLLPTANAKNAQIERVSNSGMYTLMQANLDRNGNTVAVKNGDLIRIFPVLDKMDDVVLLSGHVLTPGGYQWFKGMKVSDLIQSKNILRQGAEFDAAMIQRENREDKRTEAIYFNLWNAITDEYSKDNIVLHPRDQIIIFDTHSPRAGQLSKVVAKLQNEATASDPVKVVDFKGAVPHPGTYPLHMGKRLLDMVKYAGGLEAGVDLDYALLARTDLQSDRLYFIHVSLKEALNNKPDHNPILQPKDKVYLFNKDIDRAALIKTPLERVKRETQFGQQAPIVQVTGSVFHPGAYPMVPGMRIDDLIAAAGGMKEEAYGLAATLSRQVLMDSEFSRTDSRAISLTKNDPLLDTTNLILHPKDHLVLRVKPEWVQTPQFVEIEGEITFPGKYRIDKRETLCSLMQKVGGFTEDAYLFGTVFLRESVRQKEQKALDRMFDQLERLLADTHVSQGVNKDEKMPKDQRAKDVFDVLKKMSPEKALGRMVVDVHSAVTRCDESSDIVLEDGDRILVPKYQDDVSVIGQVYFPTSHKYRDDRAALDYIGLSGGVKELGQYEHAYIVQANGEVMSVRSSTSSWGWFNSPANVKVTPGSTIFVPLSVDRINGRESVEKWVDIFYKNIIATAMIANLMN
ncbi:polysaccharide biosynthesis/export family protein [Alteromonas sp. 009811495]|uniref:polysaccharide biosynthesis/export family protein n=1 Tax=Alteromonas sp. 009811495 TaxID=3002962 RepID=UPI00237DEDC1|nr:SLBB domain-containing protein [Alteromonas sp. 009811495]WDT85424.1 SLBB domain-containing protein [Alteromonas sp. 009811495]